ncbi:hypothetical protein KB553_09825 [Chryseobacterium rhizoplanae]|uniref:hypothetical protein n=1 Tax=Chryseobacterium rhizoplanae TaxID=1609531 RepID=UPI001CE361A1|nr:hypothetical protein [Chryseobacterium rhizoplanae]UCA61802.1 hypothetical protein KB553_09825 [Chryseobacterium rhizoplanae]
MKKLLVLILLQLSFMGIGQVGIGTSSPNSKSILDVTATAKGVLLPRMSKVQRDAIAPGNLDATRDGLLIYNTDTGYFNYWNFGEGKWVSLCQTSCDPYSFADFTINCSQFPAADTNTYTTGVSVSGNTVTLSVNVTHTGPYSIAIISDNGVSYAASGTFSATGVQNVTVGNATGAPSSSTLNFTIRSNGISGCTYTKNASTLASYTFNCASATVTPAMFQGVHGTGIVKVPVTLTGTGNIPAISQTINGVTYSFAGLTGATSATTSINITYAGTPNTASSDVQLGNSDGTFCNVHISHPLVTPARFTTSGVSAYGTYTVATQLTTSNKVIVTINVTQPGNLRLVSTDKNGIFFDSGELIVPSGSQSIVLKAATSTTGKFPMTAEETSQGNNGSNNQTSTYYINNKVVGGSSVSGSFTIDVKPKVWETMFYGKPTSRARGADNGMLRLEMQDNYSFQGGITDFYKVWVRNTSGTSMSVSIFARASDDDLGQLKKWSGTINSNEDLGSLDDYLQGNSNKPITTGEVGAHAGAFSPIILPEVSGVGATFTLYNTTGNQWFNGLGNKKFKYRFIFNSRDYRNSGTNMAVVLYGIYNISTSVTNIDPGFGTDIPKTAGSSGGNPRTGYWP